MSLSIYSCGLFHYRKYSKYLPGSFIDAIHYSHKRTTRLLEEPDKNFNHWPKEYIQQAHLRFFGYKYLDVVQGLYHSVWASSVLKHIHPSKVHLFLAHGASLDIMAHVKKYKNSLIVAEVVNAHPRSLGNILSSEHKKLYGKNWESPRDWKKIEAEIDFADFVLCPSSMVADSLVENRISRRKIITIPYGMENASSAPRMPGNSLQDKQKINVLCVGQLIPRKGQIYLLQAIGMMQEKLPDKQFSITLVGAADADYLGVLRKQNVDFTHIPHIENSGMIAFMRDFDIFVLPSLEDGFGNVVGEALSAGLPVVVTEMVGAKDLFTPPRPGSVARAADPVSLSNIIENVIKNPAAHEKTNFLSWNDYANRLVATFDDLSA